MGRYSISENQRYHKIGDKMATSDVQDKEVFISEPEMPNELLKERIRELENEVVRLAVKNTNLKIELKRKNNGRR